MARGRVARRRRRGGDVVPPRRPTRPRLATALAAVALGALLAASSAFAAARGRDLLAFLGAVVVAALVVGVVTGAAPFVSTALVVLAAEYTASLLTQEEHATLAAALFATLFFVTAELAYWTLELRTRSVAEAEIIPRRFVFVGMLALGALASSGMVLAAAAAAPAPSLLLEVVGLAAAVGIAGLLVRARRTV